MKLNLWDERSGRLVSFRQARAGLLRRYANALWCGMAIEFPNLSRRYDATRRCVRFSGYDGAIERPFFVEEEAIWCLDAAARKGGPALLEVFDRHRERICKLASQAYGKRREGSYTLTAADFS